MKRILGVFSLLSLAAIFFLIHGCDSPNSPHEQAQPYHLAATYSFPASAKHVAAQGDYAAVAVGAYGGVLLNVRDLAHIDTVMRAVLPNRFAGVGNVALDTLNHLFALAADPMIGLEGMNPLFDYRTRDSVYSPMFNGPYLGFGIMSELNDVVLCGSYKRGTSNGAFEGYRLHRDADTSQWISDGGAMFMYSFPQQSFGNSNQGEGYARRASDGVIALAIEESGVHFLADSSVELLSAITVPGSAFDCEWYQDSLLIVAADFSMIVMNAQDAAHPVVIARLTIPNSDRMRGVALDGHYACIMDGYDGIYVVDISNPRQPQYVQLLKLDSPSSVCADHGRLYATDQTAGLLVFTR